MLVCCCSLAGTEACESCSEYIKEFGSNIKKSNTNNNYKVWTSDSTEGKIW